MSSFTKLKLHLKLRLEKNQFSISLTMYLTKTSIKLFSKNISYKNQILINDASKHKSKSIAEHSKWKFSAFQIIKHIFLCHPVMPCPQKR